MIDNLFASLQVVVPLVVMMLVGNLVKRAGILNETVVAKVNDLVFTVFLPCMLFSSTYSAAGSVVASGRFLWFAALALVVSFVVINLIVRLVEKQPPARASLAHGIFRGNSVVYGSPLALSLLGEAEAAKVLAVLGLLICISNILGILTVELQLAKKVNLPQMLLRLIKNPIVISVVLALVLKGVGLKLPAIVLSPVTTLGNCTTGLAFVALGASFTLQASRKDLKKLAFANVARLLVLPGAVLGLGLGLFGFSGYEAVTLLCLFATPAAISTGPVARSMGADAELAGEIIVTTTVVSIATLFVIIFVLKTLSVL